MNTTDKDDAVNQMLRMLIEDRQKERETESNTGGENKITKGGTRENGKSERRGSS